MDINNLKEKLKKEVTGKDSDIQLLMDTLDDILQKEPGSSVHLSVEDDGKLSSLFIQLPFMKTALEKFPEVILLDATYRVNSSKMPLFTFIVEDGHGCSIPVAHFFVAGECCETLEHGFTALQKSVDKETLEKNHVFLVDKDFSEIALIKKFFPKSKIHLCLFHVMKTFKKETASFSKRTNKKSNEVFELLEKIVYSSTEALYNKYYEQLKGLATSQFLQYYTKNWHNCRHMWVSAWRKQCITMGNRTTNRLESFHQKLKATMKSSNSLAKCVEVLVRFSRQKELDSLLVALCHLILFHQGY
ncbi:PREDICTED: uncharacterized protein C19orf68-like [Priapulus caudatus]|uniref:Uncharacterized protein C19orf68-like n=1 Tax=Priapulus caudatus TaxID=37621 RepID=A0ABM1DRR4_PRICU|nr:PREDICTED: uncharacterized protein C19orf68-like [Priapulus caudatus]